ncbi:MAG: methyltransferase domain-containing protein [Asgard group archaeon]|nr:methyltransferase domain-containing protein [Asgard group archaeon]
MDYWAAFAYRLIELMDLQEGTKVLDIGTGHGDCLLAAAKKIGSKGHLIGIDKWKGCVDKTNENIKKNSLMNAYAEEMDARNLTYNDNTFDYTTFGFVGFDDTYDFQNNEYRTENTKMKHILRVLKPGGKAGFSTWLLQEDLKCLKELIQAYLSKYSSSTAEEIENVPTSYSPETIDGFERIMIDAGFKDIKMISEDFYLRYESVDDWFDMMKQVGWILKQIIGEDEDKINDFKEKMLPKGLIPYKRKDGYYFTKRVLFGFGKK